MARSVMTVRQRPAAYAIVPLDLAALDAFDNVNGMTLAINGTTELILQNPTGGALTATITSQPDSFGRSKDITAYSIAAGHYAFFQEFPQLGWANGGLLDVDASGALLYAAIQRAPGT